MNFQKNAFGFTLLEVLLVVSAIGILSAIVLVAINPLKQLSESRNAKRIADINELDKAFKEYYIENEGFPPGLEILDLTEDANPCFESPVPSQYELCATNALDCSGKQDLSSYLAPEFVALIPRDPQASGYGSGYHAFADTSRNRVVVCAGLAELEQDIVAGSNLPDIESGLVGYWKFDENTYNGTADEVKDETIYSNDGTSINGASTTSGLFNNSLILTTANQYISIPDSVSLSPTNITISFWIYVDSWSQATNYARTVVKTASYDPHFYSFSGGEGRVEWDIRIPTEFNPVSTPNTFAVADWEHIATTYDGLDGRIYFNGELVGSNQQAGSIQDSSNSLYFGHPTWGFVGKLDEVRIYNRALSPTEVREIYNFVPE